MLCHGFRPAAALLVVLTFCTAPTQAAEPGSLSVAGRVAHPGKLSPAELDQLPTAQLDLTTKTGSAHVSGPLLWTILTRAGLLDEPGLKTFLRHTILVQGGDGYAVAIAVGELDPRFEGKTVMIAVRQDGKPLASPRLIVPGDARAGRSVKDVTTIEVR